MFWTVFTSVNYKFGYGFKEKQFVIRYLTYHLRWSMEDKQINKQTNHNNVDKLPNIAVFREQREGACVYFASACLGGERAFKG